jgi:type IV pilus assembly protein PilM
MADNQAAWGIDIGQAGLKAIRLRYAEAAGQAIAIAFDYVPFPKILSQPDAVPEELIPEALEKFLSRNEVHGDIIAISVPGQSALTRFIKLPPVEESKVAEIVKYEAKQQIPFALEEVIWDFQPLSGGADPDSGFMLDAEVGLFAMKRDQVMQHLRPYTNAKVEVDLIQVAPLAMYNYLLYDHFGIRPGDEETGRDEYTIALDMGADNTTLLVSNADKIWIRSVPIGGNHFTRALTKDMKLTFAKAEHLKCNAIKSPDPRAVFQALRPVFNDYVSEIQRSIGYFSSVNPSARITKILGLGNGFKLAGLQKFLQQNLQYKVERVSSFDALAGDSVLNAPLFKENILSFVVPYGLALQALKTTRIYTSLLPPEIATTRMIRRKKPWAVAAAAAMLVGLSLSAIGYSQKLASVDKPEFDTAVAEAKKVTDGAAEFSSRYGAKEAENETIKLSGAKLVENADKRHIWADVFKAIVECLPRDEGAQRDISKISLQHRIKIWSITTERVPNAGVWFKGLTRVQRRTMASIDTSIRPSGEAYIFHLEGIHYHNDPNDKNKSGQTEEYVDYYFLKNLQEWSIERDGQAVPVRAVGITHPVIMMTKLPELLTFDPDGQLTESTTGGGFGFSGEGFDDTEGMEDDADDDASGGADGADGADGSGDSGGGGNPLSGSGIQNPLANGVSSAEDVRNLKKANEKENEDAKLEKLSRTRFSLDFVWQPIYGDKRIAFDALRQVLKESPNADFSAALESLEGLTEDQFNEYQRKHTEQSAAQ